MIALPTVPVYTGYCSNSGRLQFRNAPHMGLGRSKAQLSLPRNRRNIPATEMGLGNSSRDWAITIRNMVGPLGLAWQNPSSCQGKVLMPHCWNGRRKFLAVLSVEAGVAVVTTGCRAPHQSSTLLEVRGRGRMLGELGTTLSLWTNSSSTGATSLS